MTVFLSCYPGKVWVQSPAHSEDGRIQTTIRKMVRAGEEFYGVGYDELCRLGSGRHELNVTDTAPKGRPAG